MGAWGITERQSDDGLDLLGVVIAEHLRKVDFAGLSCYPCALYPGEMMQAAEVLKNGGDADEINRMIDDSELEAKEPFFFDLPDGAALTLQGPESKIFSRFGISCSLVQAEGEPGYELLDGGTVLLESKRDSFGRYLGGVEKDGTFLPTGRLYAPFRAARFAGKLWSRGTQTLCTGKPAPVPKGGRKVTG